MSAGRHARLWNERTIAVALGAVSPAAPRHRQNGEWKLIAETPRYRLHEHSETHETRTSWLPDPDHYEADRRVEL